MPYLLDADVLMRAKNFHYRFTVCPGFWDWVLIANEQGLVFSVAKVGRELAAGHDELAAWAKRHPTLFLAADLKVTEAVGGVTAWVQSQPYRLSAVDEFARGADSWLIAHGLAHGHTVVTHEVSAPESQRKVKIPDVCMGLGVTFTDPFQMLEQHSARFVLASSACNP